MKKYFSTTSLLFCLLILFGSQAAHAQYRLDHWTADNGLPQNSVRDIVQTRDGYLWLTTFDGLVRFDGVRFTVFNKSNSPGIITNRFVFLYEDAQGDLWASTENSGLTRLHQGRFISYTTENGLPDRPVQSMGGDGQGNLLLFCGTHLFRWLDGKFQPADDLRLPAGKEPSERQNRVLRLPFSTDPPDNLNPPGRLYSFVNGALCSWARPDFPLVPTQHPVQDQQGNTWFSSDEGLVKVENGGVIKTYTMNNGLPGKYPRFVYGQGPLQVLTMGDDRSLWLTEIDSMQSHLVAQQLPEGWKLPPFVSYMDREGNIWIGSIYDGLYRARPKSITTYAKPQGLTNSEIYPVFEDRDKTIWVGSDRLFRLQNGLFTSYPNDATGIVSAIYQDRAGELWINGRWHLKDGRFVRGISKDVLPDSRGVVWTMCEDREGAYWFGTVEGVLRYQDGAVTRYTMKDGLAGNDTKVIIEDSAGGLWIGSYGGLTHYKDGHFTAWTEHDGLPGNTVRALYQDGDSVLWIGTYDGGLGRFKDGRFTRYTMNDGLYSNGVFQILEDAAGWYWMSSNRGIYRVRKQELNDFADGKIKAITSIGYGKSDGMLNAECNGGRWPAGIRARDGKLWFPTMDGVAVIDPATMTTNAQPPPVVIEGIKIDNEAVAATTWESALQITPRQENFEIQYTALSFINSENLRFKYKLEGLDHDWVEAGTRRTAFFSHVPPGDYTFRVIAANSDGVWNEEGRSVTVIVLPPFYRTWWSLLLVGAAVSLMVWLSFRYRLAQLRRRNEQQQQFARELLASQEDERKRIAVELHDSLGQNLLVIKNRALLNAISTADEQGRTEFNEFSDAVSQTIEEVRTISHNLRPPHLDQLGLRTALVAMIEKVAASSSIEFACEIDELADVFSPDDEILLYRIVQESLNNILKHSGATQAEVRVTVNDHQVLLYIHDTGKGFTLNGNAPGRAGLGLQSITERARILGSVPTIHSVPGQGTTVMLRVERKDMNMGITTR